MSTQTLPRTFTEIHIQTSSANDGSWGPETTNEEAALVARNVCALAAAYAAKHWPGAQIETSVTSWPDTSRENYSVDAFGDIFDADDYESPSNSISEFIARHWTEEALWSADFDATAYLAAL